MSKQITIREFDLDGRKITVSADETGVVYVDGMRTSRPVGDSKCMFVWAPLHLPLPPDAKIALQPAHIDAIEAHSAPHRAKVRELARKEREYDNLFNEGGEGFNPYRDRE